MNTDIYNTLNLCGYNVGKPVQVTVNCLGKTWSAPVGWNSNQATWLTIPNVKKGYIGDKK